MNDLQGPRLKAAIIYNGIEGLDQLYRDNELVAYDLLEVTASFQPDLTDYGLLVVPNGSDQVALYRIRDLIADFLAAGKTLFSFDGWFTDWVPGNRWIMDNSKKTIDIRYRIKDDPFGISHHFNVEDLNFSHGISGWWACGYIKAAPGALVLLEDTWGRPLVVIDQFTTAGTMVLSASGPLADFSYATTDDDKAYQAMADFYRSLLHFVHPSETSTV